MTKAKLFMCAVSAVSLLGCGGSGESTQTNPLSSDADGRSSYENSKPDIHINYDHLPLQTINGYWPLNDAVGYLDVNGDGFTDVFVATGLGLLEGEVDSQLFINDTSDYFYFNNSAFNDSPPPATHARKTLVADFNNDGLMDMFVADHGYDADPYPGSTPKLVIQEEVGSLVWTRLEDQTGFHHTATAADIDNNGSVDVFVGGHDPFFYMNDGEANFSFDDTRFSTRTVYSSELIDIDEDDYVDLIVGAHEHSGDDTRIYWGSETGNFSTSDSYEIQAIDNYGTILDFEVADFNNDGLKDIVVHRTGGGNDNFYEGIRVQLLINQGDREFDEASNQIEDDGVSYDEWFPWLRAQDYDNDGDIDLFADDVGNNFLLLNDGNGNFVKSSF